MAKKKVKKVVIDEPVSPELFTFESVGDTCSGTFDREIDVGYVFIDEDDSEFMVDKMPGITQALGTPVNGKPLRETDFVIEIEYKGSDSIGRKLFKVTADIP